MFPIIAEGWTVDAVVIVVANGKFLWSIGRVGEGFFPNLVAMVSRWGGWWWKTNGHREGRWEEWIDVVWEDDICFISSNIAYGWWWRQIDDGIAFGTLIWLLMGSRWWCCRGRRMSGDEEVVKASRMWWDRNRMVMVVAGGREAI